MVLKIYMTAKLTSSIFNAKLYRAYAYGIIFIRVAFINWFNIFNELSKKIE